MTAGDVEPPRRAKTAILLGMSRLVRWSAPLSTAGIMRETKPFQGRCLMGSWRKTKAGLTLITTFMILALVICSCSGVGALGADGWGLAYMVIGLAVFVVPVLVSAIFIGACLCCTAPYPPAKKRAVISVFCFVGSLVVPVLVVGLFLDAAAGDRRDRLAKGIFAASAVLGLIVLTVYYYFFHVAVADFFQDASLRKYSTLTIILTLALAIPSVLALVVLFGTPHQNDNLFVLVVLFGNPHQNDDALRFLVLVILVCNTIILGMNSVLCIKAIRTIKRGTAATS
jgi:hypothetical protein